MTRPDWRTLDSAEKASIIKAAQADKHPSATELAALFENCTRNSILGFFHRGGAKTYELRSLMLTQADGRNHHAAKKSMRGKSKSGAKGLAFKIAKARKNGATLDDLMTPSMSTVPLPTPVQAPTSDPIPFISATASSCRWPLWDKFESAETSMICGAHHSPGSPWCEFHADRAKGAMVAA